MELEVFLQ